jgi:SAM-dependent methyltransferase
MQSPRADPFPAWFAALESRHLADLTFQEVRRAIQALSTLYVNRRSGIGTGAALEGAGKRAAFALFYGPLHFLLLRRIVRELPGARVARRVVDLGCGTGVAGAAWSIEAGGVPLLGIDRSGWALQEAAWTYRTLRLAGRVRRDDIDRIPLPGRGAAILAAFVLNEMPDKRARTLVERLLQAAARGAAVLIVEPVARRVVRLWDDWAEAFVTAGGRADEWRFAVSLPERLRELDRASGLDHGELAGRSLWIPAGHPQT